MLWLLRKAFFGHVPIPCVHVDTSYKIPEMITFRDRLGERMGAQFGRWAKSRGAGPRRDFSQWPDYPRGMLQSAEKGRSPDHYRGKRLSGGDRWDSAGRGRNAGEGAVFFAARQKFRVEFQGSATGVMGPIQDRF